MSGTHKIIGLTEKEGVIVGVTVRCSDPICTCKIRRPDLWDHNTYVGAQGER